MTWGPCMFYYHCPKCNKKFSYESGRMTEFGDEFGKCPVCGEMGVYERDGARTKDDKDYEEVD